VKPSRLTIYLASAAAICAALVALAPVSLTLAFVSVALLPVIPVSALRFLASLSLLVATVALVSDLTPALNGVGPFETTTLAEHWSRIAPTSFEAARHAVETAAGPWAWEGPVIGLISWPTFVLFGALAILCGYAGRRRHEVDIYLN
jgi:hypothetical protein